MLRISLKHLFATLSFATVVTGINAAQAAPCTSTTSCRERVDIISGKKVQIHRTYPLLGVNPDVRRAVIAIHGASKSVDGLFSAVIDSGNALGLTSQTQIIVPLYRGTAENPLSDDLYWDSGWRGGSVSINPGGRTGSYDVLDYLIQVLSDKTRYPNLKQITIAGHSAGGQVVARYAVGTQVPNQIPGFQYNFVVMNPSSYLYLDAYRPSNGSTTSFAIPNTSCSYDRYLYGMQNRNSYMSRLTASDLIRQFLPRNVTYLAGTLDNKRDSDLDVSCGADFQGANRYVRAHAYFNFLESRYPNNNHRIADVQGVGHSQGSMFRSSVGRAAVFPAIAQGPQPSPNPSPTPGPLPSPSPSPSPASRTLRAQISSSTDDAEQLASGRMILTSPDLELILNDGRDQTVGLRFVGVSIPNGAVIEEAYVEFTADEATNGSTALSFTGQLSSNSAAFTSTINDISSRPRTQAQVSWPSVPAWTSIGVIHRTPDLKSIVQEIINQSAWASGNSLAIFVNGTGRRAADSYDGSSSKAPVIVIRYR